MNDWFLRSWLFLVRVKVWALPSLAYFAQQFFRGYTRQYKSSTRVCYPKLESPFYLVSECIIIFVTIKRTRAKFKLKLKWGISKVKINIFELDFFHHYKRCFGFDANLDLCYVQPFKKALLFKPKLFCSVNTC